MSKGNENEHKILKRVTSSTIRNLMKYEVVLPSLYKDIFADKLRGYDFELLDDLDYATEMASRKLNSFEEKVTHNAARLHQEINKASDAIKAKDAGALEKIKADVTKLQSEISQIRGELYVDELTRIHNRKWLFDSYVKQGEFQQEGVVVFCDLDDFKTINDTYGHVVGDKVLVLFGQALDHIKDAKALRYAGDEFIVIFEGGDEHVAKSHMESVRSHLKKKRFQVGDDKSFKLSFSYGMESFAPGSELVGILEQADRLMYANKRMGA